MPPHPPVLPHPHLHDATMPTPHTLLILQSIAPAILTLTTLARLLISHNFLRRSLYRVSGDILATAALLLTWMCAGASLWRCVQSEHGDLAQQKEMHAKLVVVEVFGHATLIWCVKGVFLCLYLHMTEGVDVAQRRRSWLWGGVGVVVFTYFAVIGVHVGHCWPLNRTWMYGLSACRLTEPLPVTSTTALNILTDLLLMSLPILLFWTIVFRNLLAVLFLLSLGLLTIAATLVRVNLAYANKLSNSGSRRAPVPEFTRRAELWTTIEIFVAVLAASLPVLRSGVVMWRGRKRQRELVTTEMSWRERGREGGLMYGGERRRREVESWGSLEGVMGVLPSLEEGERWETR